MKPRDLLVWTVGAVLIVWGALAFHYRGVTPCGMFTTVGKRMMMRELSEADNPYAALGVGFGGNMIDQAVAGMTQGQCVRGMLRYWEEGGAGSWSDPVQIP